MNLGFGSMPIGTQPTASANGSQLQALLQALQAQQQAAQSQSQLSQLQGITGMGLPQGASPGGVNMGLPSTASQTPQGGPSAFPGNPGSMSPGQMLAQPGQAAAPPIQSQAVNWPGMNGPNTDPTATSFPGQNAPMAQIPGDAANGVNESQGIAAGLGLLAQLANGNSKNKAAAQAATPSAQSRILQSGQNGALQRLLSGYGQNQMTGLMGAYGG